MRPANLTPSRLTGAQIDALRQLAGHGSADAVRSLGQLLGAQVEGTTPRAHVAAKGTIDKVLAGSGQGPCFAVHFTVEGGARMRQLIHFTPDGSTLMAGLLVGAAVKREAVIYESSLAEACNIIVSSYLGGVGAAVGVTLVPSVPHLAIGPLEAATRAAFAEMDEALLLVTDLRLPGVRFAGRIITVPEAESLSRLLTLLGVA
jgi:chemotaxis protein CheY-P-specific phosphatase CheC